MTMEIISEHRYLSRREAASYLGVSSRLVDQWVSARRIPVVRAGRRKLFDRVDLDEFYNSQKVPATA